MPLTATSGHFDRFSENAFLLVYAWCGCNLSVEQIFRYRNSINLSTKNSFIARKVRKLEKLLYLHYRKYNALGKFRGGTLAAYSFVALETKFAGFVKSKVCSYLTLITLLGFDFI